MNAVTRWFFLLHIPITLLVDLSPLYPVSNPLFSISHSIRRFYLATFNDPLLAGQSSPGGWFNSFLFLELFVQFPICLWVTIQFHRKRQDTFETRFLIVFYSIQVMTTTWACLAEVIAFDNLQLFDKAQLVGLYFPYLLLPILMASTNARSMLHQYRTSLKKANYLESRKGMTPYTRTILITGANSGIGFGCIERLIDEYSVALLCGDCKLSLILTVRTKDKADSVVARLSECLARFRGALAIDFVYLDLTSMQAVENACREIESRGVQLDALIFNAGMAQFTKIDIWIAVKQVFTEGPLAAITTPSYKIQKLGGTTKDGLGITFQANVFGHFYMAARLKEVIAENGVIVWMSSLEATADVLKNDDIQALRHRYAYESSKRLIDVIWHQQDTHHRQYLVHPGFCTTDIVADVLLSILKPLWTGVFYVARFCGSKFHTATAYNGAYGPAIIAKNPDDYDPKTKWGSAGHWDGQKMVVETSFETIEANVAGSDIRSLMNSMNDLRASWLKRLQ